MRTAAQRRRQTMTRNLISRYGRARTIALIEAFAAGKSGQELADDYGVSRERIRQWKTTLGVSVTVYRPHAECAALLNPPKAKPLEPIVIQGGADDYDRALYGCGWCEGFAGFMRYCSPECQEKAEAIVDEVEDALGGRR